MTSTSPMITGAGLANALPSVMSARPRRGLEQEPVPGRRERDGRADGGEHERDDRHDLVARRAAETAGQTAPGTTPFPPDRARRQARPERQPHACRAGQPAEDARATRPAPIRWAPPAIGVPASAKNRPNVTALTPRPTSAPARSRVPPSAMRTALRPTRRGRSRAGRGRPAARRGWRRRHRPGTGRRSRAPRRGRGQPARDAGAPGVREPRSDRMASAAARGRQAAGACRGCSAAMRPPAAVVTGRPPAAGCWATGRSGRTGAMVPGTSIEANRDHAPVQPSGVSGHHSSGWACGAAACQIP